METLKHIRAAVLNATSASKQQDQLEPRSLRETRTGVQHHGYTAGLIHGVSYSGPPGFGPFLALGCRKGWRHYRFFPRIHKRDRQATRKWKVKVLVSCVHLFGTLWTAAHQPPLSVGFPRQGYWSGLPFPSPGDLPDPGIEPGSPALQADSLPSETPGRSWEGEIDYCICWMTASRCHAHTIGAQ